jgi:hypothetical protein
VLGSELVQVTNRGNNLTAAFLVFDYNFDNKIMEGKPEGSRPVGRPRRRWVDTIRMGLGERGWGRVDCIGLAQDRNRWRALVNAVMNQGVP